MPNINIQQYKDILKAIEYWKLALFVGYNDVQFNFKHSAANSLGRGTLRVYGITPEFKAIQGRGLELPAREYLIYQETKSENLDTWICRIPYVYDSKYNYDILESIDPDYRLIAGIGYQVINEFSDNVAEYSSGNTRVFNSVEPRNFFGPSGLKFTFNKDLVVAVDSSNRLKNSISKLMTKYGEHPAIKFTTDKNDPYKVYDTVPFGVDKYKVVLEMANSESTTKFFDSDWNSI